MCVLICKFFLLRVALVPLSIHELKLNDEGAQRHFYDSLLILSQHYLAASSILWRLWKKNDKKAQELKFWNHCHNLLIVKFKAPLFWARHSSFMKNTFCVVKWKVNCFFCHVWSGNSAYFLGKNILRRRRMELGRLSKCVIPHCAHHSSSKMSIKAWLIEP